ncbi:bcl-2 homologous antagonist/killer-like [Babylonia areolata]|uniref:bcl-2 homologous antagonist/killer-like n=1 Tax=Babylonia areolata TaxID=304850 RepID=UPI003FD3D5BC
MASWNGSSDSDREPADEFMKAPVNQVQLLPRPPEDLRPDTEENVQQQTEDVFRNFVYQQYRNDNIRQSYNNNPVDPELVNLPRVPDSPAAEVGRQLARIGDVINEKYKDSFDDMIRTLNIGSDCDTAYEAFAGVARKIFADGINWGRILTLLCFGYRITVRVLQDQLGKCADFMRRIAHILLRFLVSERISQWIAVNGGWRAALTFIPTADTRTVIAIAGLAIASILAVIVWNRFSL